MFATIKCKEKFWGSHFLYTIKMAEYCLQTCNKLNQG